MVHYHYFDTKKFRGGVESITPGDFVAPMMEVKLWKEKLRSISDKKVETQGQILFATPEIIKAYTGEDLFREKGFWQFDNKYMDIEFEWEEKEYPYIPVYNPRDYISTEVFKMVKVIKIGEVNYGVW